MAQWSLNGLKFYGGGNLSTNATASRSYTLENSTRFLLITEGYAAHRGAYIANCDSEGTVGVTTITSASGLTLNSSTANTLTITVNTTTYAFIYFFIFSGEVSVAE